MADYHPLIARAVSGLEVDTAENRRALYERARTALVTQLRSTVPPLEEAVITRERLALEEAIRKVEMESLRRARTATKARDAAKSAVAPAPGEVSAQAAAGREPLAHPETGRDADAQTQTALQTAPKTVSVNGAQAALQACATPLEASVLGEEPAERKERHEERREDQRKNQHLHSDHNSDHSPRAQDKLNAETASNEASTPPVQGSKSAGYGPATSHGPAPACEVATAPATDSAAETPGTNAEMPRTDGRQAGALRAEPPELHRRVDEALEQFRKLNGNPQSKTQAAREAAASAPPKANDVTFRHAGPQLAHDAIPDTTSVPSHAIPVSAEAGRSMPPRRQATDARPQQPAETIAPDSGFYPETPQYRPRTLHPPRKLIWMLLLFLAAGGAGAAAYWHKDAIGNAVKNLTAALRSPPPMPQTATPPRQKITDRVGQSPEASQPAKSGALGAPRAMLTTEPDPANPNGRDFVGTANWRLEQIPAAPGRPAEVAIRLDVDIPDRGFGMTWLMRRNTDPTLPATHTIDIEFKIAPNSPLGTISDIRSMLMKQPGQNDEGAPLWGHAQKSTPTYFLVGLSATRADAEHNLKLLKTQPAFDVLLVFSKSGRAFLLIEKGPAGEKVFAEAFAAWQQ
jgi:hypothetical protein